MTAAAGLVIYAAALTWLCPPLLRRLTDHGSVPRLSVLAWLATLAMALTAWVLAVAAAAMAVVGAFLDATVLTLCLDLLGLVYETSFPAPGIPAVLTALAVGITGVTTVRVVNAYRRLHHISGEHARSARIVGTPTDRSDVVIVQSDRPAAYCVAGRPHAIVVTTAAVHALTARQFAAVLAHESAHLQECHHQILMGLRALALTVPRLPLFTSAAAAAQQLLEMCADDTAARHHGVRPLVEGLAALAGCPAQPTALGAADTAVTTRVNRLISGNGHHHRRRHQILLSVSIGAAVLAPAIIAMLCQH
ncbi:MAG TPA: M56 family metallopeptidase [Mycobacterium sp.]|nr:M56 family metallopeptidase [Mycobacterium sp.]